MFIVEYRDWSGKELYQCFTIWYQAIQFSKTVDLIKITDTSNEITVEPVRL